MITSPTIHGNTPVWRQLATELPTVAILEGPRGVGKMAGAAKFATKLTSPGNILAMQNMTMQDARAFGEWLTWRSDSRKIALLEPGNCHPNVWTTLKCLLESLPSGHLVWIISSHPHPVPESISSQGFRYEFSLLTQQEMEAFFQEAQTVVHNEKYLASLGGVDQALAMNRALNVQPAVSSWVTAVEESNRRLLLTSTHIWEQRHTDLLIAEIEEQLAGGTILDGRSFVRVRKDKLVQALALLRQCPNPQVAAMAVGMTLMLGH